MVDIKKVETKKDLKNFIDFPHELYKDDPNYVPELYLSQKDLLSKKHPFFKHSKADLFLAYKGGSIVGRIAAIRNNNYIDYTGNVVVIANRCYSTTSTIQAMKLVFLVLSNLKTTRKSPLLY